MKEPTSTSEKIYMEDADFIHGCEYRFNFDVISKYEYSHVVDEGVRISKLFPVIRYKFNKMTLEIKQTSYGFKRPSDHYAQTQIPRTHNIT